MTKNIDIKKSISEIVSAHVNSMDNKIHGIINNALLSLLDENSAIYNFKKVERVISNLELQTSLSKINEKTEIRKNNGVYYTPEDVCKYMVWNSITMMLDPNNSRTFKEEDAINVGLILNIENDKIILPTKKADLKNLLSFLAEEMYKGLITNTTYFTNSSRIIETHD